MQHNATIATQSTSAKHLAEVRSDTGLVCPFSNSHANLSPAAQPSFIHTATHSHQDVDIFDFSLGADEMKQLDAYQPPLVSRN